MSGEKPKGINRLEELEAKYPDGHESEVQAAVTMGLRRQMELDVMEGGIDFEWLELEVLQELEGIRKSS